MGIKAFRRIQISNVEGTPGEAEVATEKALGVMTFEPGQTLHQPDDDRASLAMNHENDFFVGKEAHLVWSGDFNFRHIAWALCMAIRGNITPTQPDTTNEPNAYLWTIVPGWTTGNTPDIANGIDTFTYEYGDDTQCYETEYCFATQLVISGAPNEPVKFTVNITGRQKTDTTFTAALTVQSVQYAPANLVKFYLDTAWANLGDTQAQGLLRAWTWTLDTMFVPDYGADGELFFYELDEDKKAPQLQLTYKWKAASDTEEGYYQDRTTRFSRIEILGATEIDSGQDNPPSLKLDTAIRYTDWPTWGDQDGRTTIQVTGTGQYDATGSAMFQALLFTDLAAFP